jgi:hypothetical protein
VEELGLPAGTYANLKLRFLSVITASDFAARGTLFSGLSKEVVPDDLRKSIIEDADYVWKMGRGKAELLTAKNALKILRNVGDSAWFPIQAGVSEWMGDTKVYRVDHCLISASQLKELQPKLLPGDVLLIRHDWYLSNVGLPGFWPHAALYIGTPEERKKFFADREVEDWVRRKNPSCIGVDDLLKASAPMAYANSLEPEKKHPVRILEAVSEGVSFSALEHAADADSVVVLRPRLPKTEKATALLRAFHYAGRPYDFNFDFTTDSELVCTELVYKSYEPAKDMKGLRLPLTKMLGRPLLPANDIAKLFADEYATPSAQFDFVCFLDAVEKDGKAVESTVDKFRASWLRPKWHVLQQALK